MKKIVSILLCVVMVVGLLPMAAFAAENVTVTITADKETAKAGDTITYTVAISPVTGMDSGTFYVVIPAGLTVGEVTNTSALKDAGFAGDGLYTAEGIVALGCYGGTLTSTTPTTLGTFTCTVAADTHGDKVLALMDSTDYENIFGAGANAFGVELAAATVSVPKTSYTPKSLTLSYADTLAIADKNFNGTATPTLSGTDTDDEALPASELAKVEFSVDKAWADVSAAGVVSIKDIAAAEAGDITVTAKLGAVTTTATVAVTKAAPAVDKVEIAATPSTTIVKPVADAPAVEVTYVATAYDQYGAVMTEGATIEWSNNNALENVTVTAGKVTVPANAATGEFKLTATCGSKSAEITVKVTNISFAGVEDGVKATDGVYGAKLGDLVKIDASKITATAGSAVAGTYTLVDADTVPAAGDAVAYTVVFNSDDETYQNIVVAEGTVKVAKKDVTVTADNVRVDLKKELPTEWTCTIEGLLEGDELTGTATFVINNGEAVDTSVKGEYTIAVSGLTDESGNYNVTFVDGTLTVKKKNTTPPAYGTGTNPDGTEKDPDDHPTTDTSVFDDVKEGDWFYDAVNYVAENKLMTGTADKIFEPNTNTSRAMIATILWRQSGSPEPVARIADFPDVDADAWYIKAVRWCAEKEIVTGYENGNFGPNDLITREQMAAMFYRYAGSPEVDAAMGMAGFTDVDAISEWAATAMRWAVQNGILNGKDGGMLDPQGLATRAETAAVLQRYLSKK